MTDVVMNHLVDVWRVANIVLGAVCLAGMWRLRRVWATLPTPWRLVANGAAFLVIAAVIAAVESMVADIPLAWRTPFTTAGLGLFAWGVAAIYLPPHRRRSRSGAGDGVP